MGWKLCARILRRTRCSFKGAWSVNRVSELLSYLEVTRALYRWAFVFSACAAARMRQTSLRTILVVHIKKFWRRRSNSSKRFLSKKIYHSEIIRSLLVRARHVRALLGNGSGKILKLMWFLIHRSSQNNSILWPQRSQVTLSKSNAELLQYNHTHFEFSEPSVVLDILRMNFQFQSHVRNCSTVLYSTLIQYTSFGDFRTWCWRSFVYENQELSMHYTAFSSKHIQPQK